MKALVLTVVAVSIILTSGQPPQAWINYKGYWYVLYKGPHPPNVQQAGLHSPPSIHSPVPVRVSVVDNPAVKVVPVQAAPPLVNKHPPTPPPAANSVVAAPPPLPTSAPLQPPAPQRAQHSRHLVPPQQPAKSNSILQSPPIPQQQAFQQQQVSRPQKSPQQQPPTQPKQAAQPPQGVPPRQPQPPFLPAPPQQPVPARQPPPSFQPAAIPNQPGQMSQPSPQPQPQPQPQPSPPGRMSAPQYRSPSSLGSWSPVPMWNPIPPPPPLAAPSSNPGVQYLSPGNMANRGPVMSPGQTRYAQMVPQRNTGPLPNAFHPGPARNYLGHPNTYGRGGHYPPLEPPDIDIPLTPCGDSATVTTTPSLLGLPGVPNLDPRCRCEDPQDCDLPTTQDPICPAWTSCCCRPLPPTIPPGPTVGPPVG